MKTYSSMRLARWYSSLRTVHKFITAPLADSLYKESLSFTNVEQNDGLCYGGAKADYGNPMSTRLLTMLKPKVEMEVGKELCETYAFNRVYYEGMALGPHRDRPSCQVSVTITLGFQADYLWPIFVDGYPYALHVGEGVIYRGCEELHWRDPLRKIDPQGDDVHWSQVFLHYIEVGGEYDPEWRYDKNPKMFG